MKKVCIFDLDGTLVDTLDSLEYCVGLTLADMGLPPISRDQCEAYVGNGARVLLQKALEAVGEDPEERGEEALEIYLRHFETGCTYHVTPYPGIPELLQTLKERGIQIAVFSNKPHAQTVKVVETVFGKSMFDQIIGQRDELPRKPDPTVLRSLMEQLQVGPDDCLYVGDSDVDIVTGKNASMQTIIVTWGFRKKADLLQKGAEFLIDRADDLLQFL